MSLCPSFIGSRQIQCMQWLLFLLVFLLVKEITIQRDHTPVTTVTFSPMSICVVMTLSRNVSTERDISTLHFAEAGNKPRYAAIFYFLSLSVI